MDRVQTIKALREYLQCDWRGISNADYITRNFKGVSTANASFNNDIHFIFYDNDFSVRFRPAEQFSDMFEMPYTQENLTKVVQRLDAERFTAYLEGQDPDKRINSYVPFSAPV